MDIVNDYFFPYVWLHTTVGGKSKKELRSSLGNWQLHIFVYNVGIVVYRVGSGYSEHLFLSIDNFFVGSYQTIIRIFQK